MTTAADAKVDAAQAPGAVVYEFGLPRSLSDEKLALYQEAGRQIAIDVESAIGEWVPGCSVDADPVCEVHAATGLFGADSPLDDESEHDVLHLTIAGVGCGKLATELELALALVSGALGGPARAEVEPRPLSSIEARVFDLVGAAVVRAASRTLMIDGVGLERSRSDGFRGSDDEKPKDLIAFGFGVEAGGERRSLLLAFDLATLQRFSDVVDTRLMGHQRTVPVHPSPLAPLALRPVPLHLTVQVGRAELTAREVVELQAGDVIKTRVPFDADLIASAGDTDLFQVRPGQRGNRLVAEIISPIARGFDAEPSRGGSPAWSSAVPSSRHDTRAQGLAPKSPREAER